MYPTYVLKRHVGVSVDKGTRKGVMIVGMLQKDFHKVKGLAFMVWRAGHIVTSGCCGFLSFAFHRTMAALFK